MPDRAILHLTLIVESIDTIRSYLLGVDREAFLNDRLRQDAVAMNIQIIGEAARNLTEDERRESPEIPWARIVGLRHRISHDYRTIDWPTVWGITQSEFDDLRSGARRMLAARGEA